MMVAPERDTPGQSDATCAQPTRNAWPQLTSSTVAVRAAAAVRTVDREQQHPADRQPGRDRQRPEEHATIQSWSRSPTTAAGTKASSDLADERLRVGAPPDVTREHRGCRSR